jgi:uncharacterized protein YecE (DUF72 family)
MIRVGVAGWSYADWEGPVYPNPLPRGFDAVRFLGRYVDVLEINSSFYSIPDARNAERWAASARESPNLVFTAKVERGLTHEWAALGERQRDARVDALRRSLDPLSSRGLLRAWLAQFAHSFHAGPRERAWVARLAERMRDATLVLELRHRSWFEPTVLAELEAHGVCVATIDLPAASDHPPERWSMRAPLGYLRLHGRNRDAWFDRGAQRDQKYDYLYAPNELAPLARAAERLEAAHGEAIVVANNHYTGKAVANALELLFALRGQPVPAPRALVDAYPRLASATRPEGQGGLFGA